MSSVEYQRPPSLSQAANTILDALSREKRRAEEAGQILTDVHIREEWWQILNDHCRGRLRTEASIFGIAIHRNRAPSAPSLRLRHNQAVQTRHMFMDIQLPVTASIVQEREARVYGRSPIQEFIDTYQRDMEELVSSRVASRASITTTSPAQEEPVDRILRDVRNWNDEQLQAVRAALVLEGKRRRNES